MSLGENFKLGSVFRVMLPLEFVLCLPGISDGDV